jgi:hypothetical protein
VVVAGRDVGGERAERVERRFAAPLELLGHVFLDHVHGQVAINIFILGKTLTPGRNNFNPTLLERPMKNDCRALKPSCAAS